MSRSAVCTIFYIIVFLAALAPVVYCQQILPAQSSVDSLANRPKEQYPDSSSQGLNLVYSRSFLDLSKLPKEPLPSTSIVVTPAYKQGKISMSISGSNHADIGMRMMEQRHHPHGQPVPISQIIQYIVEKLNLKPRPGPPSLNFIPTREELSVLNSVWTKSEITDQQVYADLDTSVKLTAVDVNQVLKGLEAKGLLTLELISPRNELTILTPFGAMPVEMSPTNLRNRVYRYKSLVDRQHMMRYLQARLGQATDQNATRKRTPADSLRQVQELQNKIMQLVKPE